MLLDSFLCSSTIPIPTSLAALVPEMTAPSMCPGHEVAQSEEPICRLPTLVRIELESNKSGNYGCNPIFENKYYI